MLVAIHYPSIIDDAAITTTFTAPYQAVTSTKSVTDITDLTNDGGFICESSSAATSTRMIVYVGIIDVLQEYNLRKKLEHGTLLLRGFTPVRITIYISYMHSCQLPRDRLIIRGCVAL